MSAWRKAVCLPGAAVRAACKPRRSKPRLRQLEGSGLYSVDNVETDLSQGRSTLIHLADLEPQALYA
jgi:hypothetical protein